MGIEMKRHILRFNLYIPASESIVPMYVTLTERTRKGKI